MIQCDSQFWILDCACMILKSLDIPKDCQIISVDIFPVIHILKKCDKHAILRFHDLSVDLDQLKLEEIDDDLLEKEYKSQGNDAFGMSVLYKSSDEFVV